MNKQAEICVLYHANCYDGFGAAWVLWQRFGDMATYIPYKYDSPLPILPITSKIIFADVMCKQEDFLAMNTEGYDIFIIDHHKTVRERLADYPNMIFDMKQSASMLCWKHFFPDKTPPELLKFIEDRDLWNFAHKDTAMVHSVLESYPMDFSVWNKLCPKQMLEDAPGIMRLRQQQVLNICRQRIWVKLGGYTIPIVNTPVLMSESASCLLKNEPDASFAGYFFTRGDSILQFGLRSQPEFDVSEIAKQYGGGGHKNAAGFVADLTFLSEILTNEAANYHS